MTKNLIKYIFVSTAFIAFILMGCGGGNDNVTGNKVKYELKERSNSDVKGDIEFVELENGKVQIEISLSGTNSGESHPAHIHMNSAAKTGNIIISLDAVDGETGSSVTIVDKTDAGADFSYDMINELNAYVNVHKSASELGVIVAQGDIGSNTLIGESKTYSLNEKAIDGISGTITFKKRKNGFTLAEIDLNGTPTEGSHPAHIHMNSAAETGGILISLTSVDGTSGSSLTDIRATDDGLELDYEDLLSINGYVNVHLSEDELSTIVAQGDIGTNELNGESLSYDLNEKDVPGINGKVIFQERLDGTIKATIELNGTPNGGIHPAHIHENSAVEGGPIAITFNPVDGTTGLSVTSIRKFDDGSSFNFQALKNYDGYVNVHLSATELQTIVSQGDIGINN